GQLFFGKVADGWTSMFPERDGQDVLTLMHTGRLFRLNISKECVQGGKAMIPCLGRRLSFSLQIIQECCDAWNVDLLETQSFRSNSLHITAESEQESDDVAAARGRIGVD